ncbi:unnamed protein product [Danaus chrysippus]|uniref:(African queen) hypothetical protein n=1 Tax=Danaus chrysippus TaxID=151541 RepID=A0A8J2VZ12_9NEOP|nr:unnamed protein product [Danaus chrysippus]
MSVGRNIVLAAVRVVDRDIARVAVLRPQLITAVQRVVHAAEFEVKPVRELVIRRVMIVYATRNERNVNLCAENNSKNTGASDIVVVVVDGIPMDAIIDSGALNVSLISSDVLSNRFADENNSEDESPDRALSSGIGPSMPSFNENSKLGAVSVAGPSGSIPQPGVSLSIPLLDEDVEADGAGSSDDQ